MQIKWWNSWKIQNNIFIYSVKTFTSQHQTWVITKTSGSPSHQVNLAGDIDIAHDILGSTVRIIFLAKFIFALRRNFTLKDFLLVFSLTRNFTPKCTISIFSTEEKNVFEAFPVYGLLDNFDPVLRVKTGNRSLRIQYIAFNCILAV